MNDPRVPKIRSQLLLFLLPTLLLGDANISYAYIPGYNYGGFVGPGLEGHAVALYGVSAAYAFRNRIEIEGDVYFVGNSPSLSADFNYYLDNHTFVGMQAAVDFQASVVESFGPQAGYDYYVTSRFSVGPEIEYLYIVNTGVSVFGAMASFRVHL